MSIQLPSVVETSPARCDLPTVTIVIPTFNERDHIADCLRTVLATDYPPGRFEVIVVDGMSDDGTPSIVGGFAQMHPCLSLRDNPDRLPAFAMNIGISAARGEIIVRLDAHATYPSSYVRQCIQRLQQSRAANVGPACRTLPGAPTMVARTIAAALSHPFGVGNARFRTGGREPMPVDTVPFGCWRRDVLVAAGGFRTDLPYAEDDELNARLRRNGGVVLLDPGIQAGYFARPTLRRLAAMLYRYGYHKPFSARAIGHIPTWRQLVPPAFLVALGMALLAGAVWPDLAWILPLLLVLHLAAGLAGAILSRRGDRSIVQVLQLPPVFLGMHLVYGWAYLRGLVDLLAVGRPMPIDGAGR
ncbi:MAG TPA: glycosyltransferase family 2 protein [Geminicoccus sp.]|uniref:glycosyltransferase family 2 protein n=1 Tax=Geminicoccus sp. TaxID=2024832 RepID=UPI002E2FE384|nr:glycosyltransferase family 2 protein [Geminicoccus sp.]HEX2526678.1 glycosyltransferase family 2 protein [Geminicoccus sp.]